MDDRLKDFSGWVVGLALFVSLLARALGAGINSWTFTGPPGAKISSVAAAKSDPSVVYASPFSWNQKSPPLFKSTDRGTTWQTLAGGLPQDNSGIIAIDPTTAQTVYAGLWTQGLYKTTDGGQIWSFLVAADYNLTGLILDPLTPSTLYFSDCNGIHKSTDGGTSWVGSGGTLCVYSLAIDSLDPINLYAGTELSGIFKSTDAGATWNAVNNGLPNVSIVASIAVDPNQSSVVYAVIAPSDPPYIWEIFKSTDGGITWNLSNNGIDAFEIYTVAVDPANSAHVFAGTVGEGLLDSTDAGNTWSSSSSGLASSTISSVTTDSSDGSRVLAGGYGGVFASTDGGSTWSFSSGGMMSTDVFAIGIDPADSSVIYAGSYGGGVFRSSDGGTSWVRASQGMANTNVLSLLIDPANPQHIYAGTEGGVFQTTDGAATWTAAGINLTTVPSLTFQPGSTAIIYAGTITLFGSSVLYKSTDAGGTWNATSSGLPNDDPVNALAIDPANPLNLFASVGPVVEGNNYGGVFASTDGGLTWIATGFTGGPSYALVADPGSASVLYAGAASETQRTTDAGNTWTPFAYGHYVDALQLDPSDSSVLYSGDYYGSVRKTDSTGRSGFLGLGLLGQVGNVNSIKIDPNDFSKIFVGVNDAGFAWMIQVPPTATGIAPASGSTNGGDTVTISGSNFMSPESVTIGGVPLTSVTVIDPNTVQGTTGPQAAGVYDVVVTNPTLMQSTLPSAFTYQCLGPSTAVVSGDTTICQGWPAYLFATLTGVPPWSLSWSDGYVQNSPVPYVIRQVSPASTTVYSVVSVSDSSGCGPGVPSGSATVTVNSVPPPTITAPLSVPPGATGVLARAAGQPGSTFSWSLIGGTITGGWGTNQITFDAGPAGTTMIVEVQEFGANSCFSPLVSAPVQIDFLDVPPSNPFHDFVDTIARNGITSGCGGGNFCPGADVLRSQMSVFLLRSEHGPSYVPPACTVASFNDVPCSNPFSPWIYQLVAEGITGGCGGGNFCPDDPVFRSSMAVFLLVTEHGTGYTPPACTPPGQFTDVPCPGSGFTNWIYQLVAEGITGGCTATTYCPTQDVSRAQMAVFLVTTFNLP
jgi:photosystem II stability/assembly factor-like uncharacterized protein